MAEFPALPIFTDAFIADTVHLTAAQTGAYFMLLMVAWRTSDCCLPNDDNQLCRFARMDKGNWLKNRDIIMSFWHTTPEGRFYQKRLRDERKLAESRRDQAIIAGRASALKRKERHSTDVATESQPKGNYPKPNPLPSSNTTKVVLAEGKKSVSKPDDVSENIWNDHLKNRKAKRQPITQTALEAMRTEAAKLGWTLEAALKEACERGWGSFKAEWISKEKPKLVTQAKEMLENGW